MKIMFRMKNVTNRDNRQRCGSRDELKVIAILSETEVFCIRFLPFMLNQSHDASKMIAQQLPKSAIVFL